MWRNNSGFTLIELVVVISITAVLSTVIAPILLQTVTVSESITRGQLNQQRFKAVDLRLRQLMTQVSTISTANSTSFSFQSNGIEYAIGQSTMASGDQQVMFHKPPNAAQIYIRPVAQFNWYYLNQSGEATSTPSAIRAVGIKVRFPDDNQTYSGLYPVSFSHNSVY